MLTLQCLTSTSFIYIAEPSLWHRFLILSTSGRSLCSLFQFIMGKKNLRKGTRKDYEKLASGPSMEVLNEGECNEPGFSGSTVSIRGGEQNNDNNNNIEHHDGDLLQTNSDNNKDVVRKENDGASCSSSECDDDEILEAQRKLEAIRVERHRLSKKSRKSKLERLNQEVEEAERSLNKLKKKRNGDSSKRKEKKLNVDALRDMEDVMVGVDNLMDKNLNLGRRKQVDLSGSDFENSSDFSSSTSDSFSSSDLESEVERRERKRKSHKKKKGKSSGRKKSGKSKRLTSYVKFPQKWPHSALSLHFVNKEKKFEELSISEFCAGYATILEMCSERTRAHRIAHLKELMYLATKYQWRCILNYHAAVLLEIERGHLRWGDSFQILQNTTLAGGFLHQSKVPSFAGPSRSQGASANSSPSTGRDEGTLFCRGYQRGTCKQARDHYGWFNGESRLLKHICAKCWLKSRTVANHPETDDSCPNKDEH